MKQKSLSNREGNNIGRFIVNLLFGLVHFTRKLILSTKSMTRIERRLTGILLVIAVTAASFQVYGAYEAKTALQASPGGEYREAIVGELKYLNPILVQNDVERASSKLIFSSLVTADKDGIYPSVAEKWEAIDGGRAFSFSLRKDVFFHDGVALTAKDVLYTVDQIKTVSPDGSKSPLYDVWKDVNVSLLNDYQIKFELPRVYGPFVYNATFGILPEHVGTEEIARRFIGSGPFRYETLEQAKGKGSPSQLRLKRNDDYVGDKAFFDQVTLMYFAEAGDAVKAFKEGRADAIFGATPDVDNKVNLSYKSSKRLGLIFNLRNDKFKDKEQRRKILIGEKLPESQKIRLVTLNAQLQKDKAEELKNRFAGQNIELDLIYLNPIQLKDVLDSKEFELLLYGFDFGYDRDPYVFWHSSQAGTLNFAGYAEKTSDILLEDSRMILDAAERNKKYDQFFEIVRSEYLAEFYDPVKYQFAITLDIQGLSAITGTSPGSRYQNATKWYIKEKRVWK